MLEYHLFVLHAQIISHPPKLVRAEQLAHEVAFRLANSRAEHVGKRSQGGTNEMSPSRDHDQTLEARSTLG